MLDCKICREPMQAAPRMVDELCGECEAHLEQVKRAIARRTAG